MSTGHQFIHWGKHFDTEVKLLELAIDLLSEKSEDREWQQAKNLLYQAKAAVNKNVAVTADEIIKEAESQNWWSEDPEGANGPNMKSKYVNPLHRTCRMFFFFWCPILAFGFAILSVGLIFMAFYLMSML